MLEVMRSHKFFSYMLMAIIFVITISFVFWGIGPNTNPTAAVIAEIENEQITIEEFWQAYDNEYKRLQEIYTDEEEIQKLGLRESVLEALIQRRVILIAAEKAGISVSDEELQNEIMELPYFQRDGVFDRDIYVRFLNLNLRMNPAMFESRLRNDLIFLKMSRLIKETVEFSTEELQTIESLRASSEEIADAFFSSKNNQAIKAYADSMKRRFEIRINWDLIT